MADTHLTGTWPIDTSDPVGLLRVKIGDTAGTPHAPADGKAEFQYVGDVALQGMIDANPDAPNSAQAQAMVSMANQMIIAAQDIQVDDIKIKTIEKANLMLRAATELALGLAASEGADSFEIVAPGSALEYSRPQGTPWPMSDYGYGVL